MDHDYLCCRQSRSMSILCLRLALRSTGLLMPLPEVIAQPGLQVRLRQGHPWVYRNQLVQATQVPGSHWVRLRCGNFSAVGLWDSRSPIAVRIYAYEHVPDADWFAERVWQAWDLRAALRDDNTNAYRWIYGEGDGLPGIVVDRYGDYAVVQPYADSAASLIPMLLPALRACDPGLRGILTRQGAEQSDEAGLRGAARRGREQVQILWGEAPPEDLVVVEQGLFFRANLYVGQKTGLFLDQRANRATVERIAAGRRVLNCFAYTGGFSLYAMRGGAAEVVSVDSGHGLAEAVADNLVLNRFGDGRHRFVTEDCFTLLDTCGRSGRRFDMVILDPPSFARSRSSAYAARRAYVRLNMLAMRCLEPGGTLVSASCTSQIAPDQFRELLADAAQRAECRLTIVHEAGQSLDHPVPAAFPEGRYLKFVIGRVADVP